MCEDMVCCPLCCHLYSWKRPFPALWAAQAVPTLAAAAPGEAPQRAGMSGLLFPSPIGRPLSNTATSKLLKENGIPAVTHGFRSSFRDWCAESGVSRELAQLAIGHTAKGIEGAYKRTDALEAGRPVVEQWGEFISLPI